MTAEDVLGLTAHINHADGNRKPAVIMITDEWARRQSPRWMLL